MDSKEQAPLPEPRLIPLDEAARLLGGVSARHLRTLAGRGDLRLVRLGRRVLVPRDELERIVREGASS